MTEQELVEKIAETYFHWRVRDTISFAEQDRAVKVICYGFADQISAIYKEAGYKSPEEISKGYMKLLPPRKRMDMYVAGDD